MKLLIVRHAIAVERGTPGIPDDERPLTPEGERRFARAAAGLARILPRPDAILTSPLPRALRTAQIASEAWKGPEPTAVRALAGADFEALAQAVDAHPRGATVALVGHEPYLSELLARVLGAGEASRLAFKKGGAALVRLDGGLLEGGRLAWFLPPRVLRALAE